MNCRQGASSMIDQILSILDVVEQDHYSQSLDIYNGSSIGKHFRHIYDFFNCIAAHVSDDIDYCLRDRDSDIEIDKKYASQKFENLKQDIRQLDESKAITVHADFELADGVRPQVSTTVGRELMYAYDHAVHHLAIVKIGLKYIDPDMSINPDIGVAASTIRHQQAHTHV